MGGFPFHGIPEENCVLIAEVGPEMMRKGVGSAEGPGGKLWKKKNF